MPSPLSDAAGPVGFRAWRVPGFHPMPRAHTHPDIEINCIEKGFIDYLFAGRQIRVAAGSLAVFWGGVPHQLERCSRTGRGVWLTLPISDFLRWALPGGLAERLMGGDLALMSFPAATADRWLADFEQGGPDGLRVMRLEMEAALHRLALQAGSPVRSTGSNGAVAHENGSSHVERVTAFISRHYADALSLPRIAAAVRLNPKYLTRIFKARTRLSVHDYLTRVRIAHAQRLLATSDLRVVDVALQSGFGSLASFYAAFARNDREMTPHRYRRAQTPSARPNPPLPLRPG